MPDVDIEITDAPPDTGEYAYPMATELRVEGFRVGKGDLLYSPADERVDSTWDVIKGFDWGGIHTDSITKFQMPQFREWSKFVDIVKNEAHQIVHLREETSFYSDEETVRSLSYYQHHFNDGWQPILIEKSRHPLETTSELQYLKSYDSLQEMVDDIYTSDTITNIDKAEAIYEFLINSGVNKNILTPPDEISTQSGLNEFAN